MNNTKWKGSLIKVQPAKESFIEKLRREQQENRMQGGTGRSDHSLGSTSNDFKGNDKNNSELSRNQRQANDILHKLSRSKERRNKNFQDRDQPGAKHSEDCGFEVVNNNINLLKKPLQSPSKVSKALSGSPSAKSKNKFAKKSHSSSSEEESDDEIRDGIPKFKGLLFCYPEGLPSVPPPPENEDVKPPVVAEKKSKIETNVQKKLLSIAFEVDNNQSVNGKDTDASSHKSGINFKKTKQQKSDLLRLQSLEKMKELKEQRKNLIKSSLSSVAASAPITEQRKLLHDEEGQPATEGPVNKKSKMALFGDDDDDQSSSEEEEGDTFKVKKQFEGTRGQKLLELKTRWGNDDRFKIDDRFKEVDDEEMEPAEQEKEKQFGILTDILGKVVSTKGNKGTSAKSAASSVITPRYDPEADDANENEVDDTERESEERAPKSVKIIAPEKVVRSTEPATFKTASNLKALFSSAGDNDSEKETTTGSLFSALKPDQPASFSLLATFGKKADDNEGDKYEGGTTPQSNSGQGPRTFWQSNPFRYDSSDDEDDSKVKVTVNSKQVKPSSSFVVHGKASFFFTENDTRFEGLEDYFLKGEETEKLSEDNKEGESESTKEKQREEFAIKRQELKSIVKAKIRNSRRKDEKRTLAIKRAIRKRKSKMQQRGRTYSK